MSSTQRQSPHLFTISKQVDRDISWSQTILIIIVAPLLSNCFINSRWHVRVGNRQVRLVVAGRVTSWHNLFNRVSNGLAFGVLIQFRPSMSPVMITSGQCDRINHLPIS